MNGPKDGMSYRHLLALLGALLVTIGMAEGGWTLLALWPGGGFVALAIAHRKGAHRLFGKRPDGSLPLWSWLVFFPLLVYMWAIWHLTRIVKHEPARSVVSRQLVIGRRLLASELDENFDNYIDLTAEFAEPSTIRRSPAYRSFPILNDAAPSPEALRAAIHSLRPGRTFVHCGRGYGRAGLFALAALLTSGEAASVEDGMRMLRAARPGVRLNQEQQRCIQLFAKL